MCGIFAVFGYKDDPSQLRQKAVQLSKRIRHRGPDWSGVNQLSSADGKSHHIICHERLAIVGVVSGAQPLVSDDGYVVLCVNGEIYNHIALQDMLIAKRLKEGRPEPQFTTGSDCEVIMYLWEDFGLDMLPMLDGMFAFVLYDKREDRYIAARDAIGVIPLYQGRSKADGSVWFSSEMKTIYEDTAYSGVGSSSQTDSSIFAFEPGCVYDSKNAQVTRWFNPDWFSVDFKPPAAPADCLSADGSVVKFPPTLLSKLKETLERSVEMHMMAEVPYGVLLSGGLDSSLIASIAARLNNRLSHAKSPVISERMSWGNKLHSFSIGLKDSPDLLAARQVAKHIKTRHFEFNFTIDEGLDAIRDVIYHLETYDVTTIRASTPMYLLSRKIKAMGVKMVLSGEGADEMFGGYLYFHDAPDAQSLHHETVARVKLLHTSDCLRANKSTMAWGLEARVPFLTNKDFLQFVMAEIPAEFKHPRLTPKHIEKEILRQAFDVEEDDGNGNVTPYLPKDILWRQKEQFSDGVGYSWIDTLRDNIGQSVSEQQWQDRAQLFPYNTPTTREAFYYRQVFEDLFCQPSGSVSEDMVKAGKLDVLKTVVKWIPRKDWGCAEDPSGRAQKSHQKKI
ncbi:hypothetical protein MIR68_008914 [Amoeboaphelidium protococcarum]|nr:hypothetical protein MIR68_008914 [Amoeboaphelidium protococcarum]